MYFFKKNKRLSLTKRKLINEVIYLWRKTKRLDSFVRRLINAGWSTEEDELGSFKHCFIKKSIVVKIPNSPIKTDESYDEMTREVEQWVVSPYKFKKHLPTIHAFINNKIIIQDRVEKLCCYYQKFEEACPQSNAIAKKFPLADYAHNHGHTKNNVVKFFDWVYNRTNKYIMDPSLSLKDTL